MGQLAVYGHGDLFSDKGFVVYVFNTSDMLSLPDVSGRNVDELGINYYKPEDLILVDIPVSFVVANLNGDIITPQIFDQSGILDEIEKRTLPDPGKVDQGNMAILMFALQHPDWILQSQNDLIRMFKEQGKISYQYRDVPEATGPGRKGKSSRLPRTMTGEVSPYSEGGSCNLYVGGPDKRGSSSPGHAYGWSFYPSMVLPKNKYGQPTRESKPYIKCTDAPDILNRRAKVYNQTGEGTRTSKDSNITQYMDYLNRDLGYSGFSNADLDTKYYTAGTNPEDIPGGGSPYFYPVPETGRFGWTVAGPKYNEQLMRQEGYEGAADTFADRSQTNLNLLNRMRRMGVTVPTREEVEMKEEEEGGEETEEGGEKTEEGGEETKGPQPTFIPFIVKPGQGQIPRQGQRPGQRQRPIISGLPPIGP
jgi:hypothetical protein